MIGWNIWQLAGLKRGYNLDMGQETKDIKLHDVQVFGSHYVCRQVSSTI